MSLRSSNNSPPVGPGEEIVVSDDESDEDDSKRTKPNPTNPTALDTFGISKLVRSFLSLKDQSKMLQGLASSKNNTEEAKEEILKSLKKTTEQWYTPYFVSGSYDRTLKIWRQTGECLQTLQGHTHWVSCCAIFPDTNNILSGSYDGTLKIWNQDGECVQTLHGPTDWVFCCAIFPDDESDID